MFDIIKGTIIRIGEQAITVQVSGTGNSALGLYCYVPNSHLFSQKDVVELEVHMHWHAEQGPTLFGFPTVIEKQLFKIIIGCSGIGPRLALALLHDMTPTEIVTSVTTNDMKALSKVSGIGLRKAENMIVQLRPKITTLLKSGITLESSSDITKWKEVTEALESLNYSRQEITRAMSYLNQKHAGSKESFNILLRHALSFLAKRL